MSSATPIDKKQVVFIASAQRDFENLPTKVREEATEALSEMQNERLPKFGRYKALSGDATLEGIVEIRSNGDDGNTYRIYNVISFKEVVYVLDAGFKKSPRGGSIPDVDKSRLAARKVRAERDYRVNMNFYREQFEKRRLRRERLLALLSRSRGPKGS